MNVNLYYNTSDDNRVSKNLSLAFSASGTLKEPCSITDPVITIAVDDIHNVNYMHIPNFNRYYFITKVVVLRKGLWEVTGHVDVLMTYASDIRSLYAIVNRQQNVYNLYLDDDKFLVESRRSTQLLAFPGGPSNTGRNFALTIAGYPDALSD